MSELVWGIKNGDIDQVKDIVENKVSESAYIRKSVIFQCENLLSSWQEKAMFLINLH